MSSHLAGDDTVCHLYDSRVARWKPNARDRLVRAAAELFAERGFDETTIPDITARAGLTTRTYFRHFPDKREVLFTDEDKMPALAVRLIHTAPAGLQPFEVLAHGLPTLAGAIENRRDELHQRRTIIDSHEGLRERELRKMAVLVDAITNAFRLRGTDDLTAAVVAETGVAIVKISLQRWISTPDRDLAGVLTETLNALTAAATALDRAT